MLKAFSFTILDISLAKLPKPIVNPLNKSTTPKSKSTLLTSLFI